MKKPAASNQDEAVVKAFGEEWGRFTQDDIDEGEQESIFHDYFGIFPWSTVDKTSVGADFGCGSGRWAVLVAPRVGRLHLIDASEQALSVARKNLASLGNVEFHHASLEKAPLADGSLDFGYCLGVLHHVPDTKAALAAVTAKLKPGAPLLVYLYYAFDNRPAWFRAAWRASELARALISRAPKFVRFVACDAIALTIYWPLARMAKLLDGLGIMPTAWPLSWYRSRPFYVMRTDALDRFGTRLEKRFTRKQIEAMLVEAGLRDIHFSQRPPFWCAVGARE